MNNLDIIKTLLTECSKGNILQFSEIGKNDYVDINNIGIFDFTKYEYRTISPSVWMMSLMAKHKSIDWVTDIDGDIFRLSVQPNYIKIGTRELKYTSSELYEYYYMDDGAYLKPCPTNVGIDNIFSLITSNGHLQCKKGKHWRNIGENTQKFDFINGKYRIKPYRPFSNREECFDIIKNHSYIKHGTYKYDIDAILDGQVCVRCNNISIFVSFEDLCANYTFENNTPVGI